MRGVERFSVAVVKDPRPGCLVIRLIVKTNALRARAQGRFRPSL